ncbi:MAG TPA: HlyD family efflux transporter periplasmic adaptor subunit [Phaeodactylibacter sp.]|nr:HlyD family efflux transporter periplasmic adaptor subunit [Phaeodactylibacter sp.]
MAEKKLLERRSEEIRDILSAPPAWLARWGTLVVFLVFVLILAIGMIFYYPEKITAEITLTTADPPIPLIAQTDGYIKKIRVEEGDTVEQGAILAMISSTASLEDVISLEESLKRLQSFDKTALYEYEPQKYLRLGELQADYRAFLRLFQEFSFERSEYDSDQTRRLKSRLKRYLRKRQNLQDELQKANERRDALQRQLDQLQKRYEGDMADLEKVQAAREALIDQDMSISQLEDRIFTLSRDIDKIKAEIIASEDGSGGDIGKYQVLLQAIAELDNQLQDWKNKYLLMAPEAGVVSFYSLRPENRYVHAGERVMAIVPIARDNELVGEILLPVTGSGKVKIGQRVLIRFESYPYEEFGIVEGRVTGKALLPQNDSYFVTVSLPNGLLTNKGETLPFHQLMSGQAEILTDEKRLVDRLLGR